MFESPAQGHGLLWSSFGGILLAEMTAGQDRSFLARLEDLHPMELKCWNMSLRSWFVFCAPSERLSGPVLFRSVLRWLQGRSTGARLCDLWKMATGLYAPCPSSGSWPCNFHPGFHSRMHSRPYVPIILWDMRGSLCGGRKLSPVLWPARWVLRTVLNSTFLNTNHFAIPIRLAA